jgi:hypothetical protein
MTKITVHAGDFTKGDGSYLFGKLILRNKSHCLLGEKIPAKQLKHVTAATEETVKKFAGTVGWGAVGAIALGPVGLLAGLLLGGKSKEVTFIAELEDGRKLLATTDNKTFIDLQAEAFGKS